MPPHPTPPSPPAVHRTTAEPDRYGTEEDSSISTHEASDVTSSSATGPNNPSNSLLRATLKSAKNKSGRSSPVSRNTQAASRLLAMKHRARNQEKTVAKEAADEEDTHASGTEAGSLFSIESGSYVSSASQSAYSSSPKKSPTLKSQKDSFAHSAATRRALRNRAKERNRVAGGAAAKLMLTGKPKNEESFEDQDEDELGELGDKFPSFESKDETEFSYGLTNIEEVRKRTMKEWKNGSEDNTRYQQLPEKDENNTAIVESEASMPSVLKHKELFHDNAAASVVSLLARRAGDDVGGNLSIGTETGSVGVSGSFGVSPRTPTRRASSFRNPLSDQDSVMSPGSVASGTSSVTGGGSLVTGTAVSGGMVTGGGVGVLASPGESKRPRVAALLTPAAQEEIEALKNTMVAPSKTLSDLLAAICSPADGQEMDRGYMVRRKNACGALKVLTMKNENRRTMCWTVGVLSALRSVLDDAGTKGIKAAFPDGPTRRDYMEARNRAVASLLNLSVPTGNRLAIFHSPGMVQALLNTIEEDTGESRQGCCAILAYLARTVENRILMSKVPELVDSVTAVIRPYEEKKKEAPVQKKKNYHWDDDDSVESEEEGHMDSMMTGDSELFAADTCSVEMSYEEASMTKDNCSYDSDITPQTSPKLSPKYSPGSPKPKTYDTYPNNRFLHGARQNVFALLRHLVKEKANSVDLVRNDNLIPTLVAISKMHDSPSHTHAVVILAHLTRHRGNAKSMVFKQVVPALVNATFSESHESTKYACYAMQNLSQDKACRQEMANTKNLLTRLCHRALISTDEAEKLAAISALKHLSDEPANLIPMANTPECIATFMKFASGNDDGVTERMRYLACDGLATLSHWLRTIATSGQAAGDGVPTSNQLFVPSQKVITWTQWE